MLRKSLKISMRVWVLSSVIYRRNRNYRVKISKAADHLCCGLNQLLGCYINGYLIKKNCSKDYSKILEKELQPIVCKAFDDWWAFEFDFASLLSLEYTTK